MDEARLRGCCQPADSTLENMRLPVLTISDVCTRQLCTGCGVCAAMEPERFAMGEDLDLGHRPFLRENAPEETGEAMACCPGASLRHDAAPPEGAIPALAAGWGPVLEVWEAHASDETIRRAGSSGGAATAIALSLLERGSVAGVIHIGAREDAPYLNETRISRSRAELLEHTGSRYAPASPCDRLGEIEAGEESCVFIGKPCDVAATVAACSRRPALAAKIKCTIAFFCAGAPSTRGTLELLKRVGVENPSSVKSLRYRGNGWPGRWTVRFHDGTEQSRELTYSESWGFLQRFRQWRCYICPDHTGEFADIAVGDPWYRSIEEGEPGSSLIVVRTLRGRAVLQAAVEAGAITLNSGDPNLLPTSQPGLLKTRGGLWIRLKVLRLLGAAVPNFEGFELARFWWSELSLRAKVSSFTGTVKRVFKKGLRGRVRLHRFEGRLGG